jgi:aryl-alcohol dehydrogenase-like predicted oxidoreductase
VKGVPKEESVMSAIDKAGTFTLGSRIVRRLGYGAMQLAGPGVFGPPKNPDAARAVLRAAVAAGVNHIDTSDYYGPHVTNQLIREALHPYPAGLIIATKGGHDRPGPDRWEPNGRPEQLRKQVHGSLKRLGLEQIPLWQLHRIDPKVPRKEQFDAIHEFRKEGLIRHAGLSEVGVADIEEAQNHFQVVTVQNRYSPAARGSDAVLEYCTEHTIGFIPWAPLGSGSLAKGAATLQAIADKYKATTGQVSLAWLLKRSPVMLPIPGTSKVAHLEENVAAAAIHLSDQDEEAITEARH